VQLVTSSETFGWCQPKTERVPAEDLGAARRPCSVAQKLVPGPITSDAAAAANVPRPPPYPPARWQPAAAAVLLLPPCRLTTGGNSRSKARTYVARRQPCSSGFRSVCCIAALCCTLHCCAVLIASLSTFAVTTRCALRVSHAHRYDAALWSCRRG
jgi:hypothetical protein